MSTVHTHIWHVSWSFRLVLVAHTRNWYDPHEQRLYMWLIDVIAMCSIYLNIWRSVNLPYMEHVSNMDHMFLGNYTHLYWGTCLWSVPKSGTRPVWKRSPNEPSIVRSFWGLHNHRSSSLIITTTEYCGKPKVVEPIPSHGRWQWLFHIISYPFFGAIVSIIVGYIPTTNHW